MAALGKIRSKGVLLISIIGFALFAFIAEELFRSCESHRNESRQQVGEVLGEKVSVQDFQKLVDEYTAVIKMTQGRDNLTDEELNQVKDVVWNTYIQNQLISHEAEKIGLTVTDQEMQNILNQGTNPMLLNTPFVNQQTGRFDANVLKKFMAEYKQAQGTNPQLVEQYQSIYNYWTFIEKSLRTQILAQKYQALLAGCMLSNPVSAKMAFKDENEESSIQLASLPYSSINDNKVQVSDADLKAKYEELKPTFKLYDEARDIKYVDFQVVASAADRAALNKTFAGYAQTLAAAADPADVVKKSGSSVNYLGIAQTKAAFPSDIAAKLDSMSVGQTTAVVENKRDNTLNIIKLLSKTQLPDSVEFRAIQVGGTTPEETAQRADSIYKALQAGADFEAMAKKYGQNGSKSWITSQQYQNAPSLDSDTKAYIESLNTMGVNETKNLKMTQGNIILQVLNRKAMTTKYVAAVIKKTIDFSKDTYSQAYNKFSQFVSESQTVEALEKNAAKYGFKLQERQGVQNSEHYVAGVRGTREAMKWLFDAKENTISPLYECGDNDHLFVMALNKINKKGYMSLDDEKVKEYVKQQVIRDKKAEMLMAQVKGVNSISAAKAKGAQISTVNQITFAAPVFVQATMMREPALSGAVAATAKGKFSAHAVKGNAGVYLFQVVDKKARPAKYNEKEYEQRQRQKSLQSVGNFMRDLYLKANVTDNRYLFF
ncbi:MAG: SurA N-terminal domain-containing protein [Bacteroidales bacterium]|nr:SurA N-terminal domain-containing protein [Bacteroidales bacterium]MDD6897233.1 SurA N-terminal domain-containing protein [Bacteroidales bacterium]MDY4730933.1 peptidylprolyl isomerase [Prevotella sp.]